MVAKLLPILESTNSTEVKLDAVIVLGQYRAKEAVPFLVQHLEWDEQYPAPMSGSLRSGTSEQFLARGDMVGDALWSIGSTAVPALMDRIVETDATNITAKCVLLCYRIEGRDLTQRKLQELAELATDDKKKKRIQSALDVLKKVSAYGFEAGGPELLYRVGDMDHADDRDFVVGECKSELGLETTKMRLHRLLEKETDPTKKARIQSALDHVEKSNRTK
jgi:hypothetical protein